MPSLPFVASYTCARNPDGALGKIIAARKQRALAGCKREGAVCICNTINFVTKSFLTSPETLSYITLCIYMCPYIYLLKFLMNHLFSCCFEITITPGASGPHAASHIRGAASWRPMLLAVSSFVRWTGGVWIVERHRSQKIYRFSEENRSKWVRFRIATYRSTGYNPILCSAVSAQLPGVLMFWNPTGTRTWGSVSRMRADPDVLGVVNNAHRSDSQKISVFRC